MRLWPYISIWIVPARGAAQPNPELCQQPGSDAAAWAASQRQLVSAPRGARHRRYDGSPDHKEHPQPAPQVKVPSYQREGGGEASSDRRRSGSLGRRSTATSSDLSPARGCAGGAPGSRSVWEGVGRRRAPRAARGAAALRWSPPSVTLRDRIVGASRKRPSNSNRSRDGAHPTPLKLAVHYCLSCGLKSLSALHSSGAEH